MDKVISDAVLSDVLMGINYSELVGLVQQSLDDTGVAVPTRGSVTNTIDFRTKVVNYVMAVIQQRLLQK